MPLVLNGGEARLPRAKDEDGKRTVPAHTLIAVHTQMLLQVCLDYPGLPDVRTLTLGEIRFFYDGIRQTLRKHYAPKE